MFGLALLVALPGLFCLPFCNNLIVVYNNSNNQLGK